MLLTPRDFNGLRSFSEDYPQASCYLLYGGQTHYHDKSVQVMSFPGALKILGNLLKGVGK